MKTDGTTYTNFTGWIDRPEDLQPALHRDLTCDIAIIGGGMGGMAAALRLAERDQDVVLLEAEFCGYGAASRNGGQIAGAPGGDLRMLSLQSPKKMPVMVKLAENAGHYVEDLMKTHDIECDYVANGLVWGAVSPIMMLRVRTQAAILRAFGGQGTVGSREELGLPAGFVGGMRENIGGMLNPGKLARGVRRALLASSATVFEQSRVSDVRRTGSGVELTTAQGTVRANKVVLATNAYGGEWDITPQHLSTPLYVIEIESEPIDPERLAELEWTSRSGIITQHQLMTHYRLTERNTIVCGVRHAQRGLTYPLPDRVPDPGVVRDMGKDLSDRFPSLSDVAIERAWGGWIGITPDWLAIAGQVGDNVYYSMACNGHGLCQVPYVASQLADYVVDGEMSEDLAGIWSDVSEYPSSMSRLLKPFVLRAVWGLDRFNDSINGSKTLARRRPRRRRHER
ncbi:FAD-binding oxidoreductase [Nocardioides panacisoli]|uniref:NAD(P)/FAD-dependent oxidoreductase n=1 Tax=Nocardioides panacisoli TaxID=627624 RepID=UPI001C62626C|nr:FAD-binding oxidoreductase [Nocardioides panacisoli]QYJ03515.1 FAD-binding oxidoreductase [Nocardioides panacisoli]